MNSSKPVSIATSIVSPSPQISQSGPITAGSTDHSSSETATNPSTQTPSVNQNSVVTNVNSIVGIVVALSIAFCILFVGAVYICCRARRRRKNRVIKTYGQDFSDPNDDLNKTPILINKLPTIEELTTAKVNRPTRNPTHSTATSVSRYSTVINQTGPSFNNYAIPEQRLAKNKKYGYF